MGYGRSRIELQKVLSFSLMRQMLVDGECGVDGKLLIRSDDGTIPAQNISSVHDENPPTHHQPPITDEKRKTNTTSSHPPPLSPTQNLPHHHPSTMSLP